MHEPEWYEQAQCRGTSPDIFFSEGDDGEVDKRMLINIAKSICEPCPVRTECLAFALETKQPVGVWGGLEAKERNRLRKRVRVA